jgi:predicted MFS family arabinose efflux permease
MYFSYIRIPTLLQAGYATGILFITPLGDLLRRRQLVLALLICSASLSIGLAITSNVKVFEVLSFLVGVITVTPQILVPLAADLAPPERRASAVAVVISGLMFGICKLSLFLLSRRATTCSIAQSMIMACKTE